MTDKPIIFSAPMVRALIEGRKTQTRRIISPQPEIRLHFFLGHKVRYAPGDRLWVKEACATWGSGLGPEPVSYPVVYADDTDWKAIRAEATVRKGEWKVRSPIHMPRWASRLTLTVTDVRVQRVQDISEEDAIAEGVSGEFGSYEDHGQSAPYSYEFSGLWNTIHGPAAWERNDWVAAYTFTVQRGNIDGGKS